jgi:hypothetical protein
LLTPRLSSYWLDLVTPFPPAVTRPLIEGMRSESVCTARLAKHLFPAIQPVSYDAAVATALQRSAPTLPLRESALSHRTVRDQGVICDMRACLIDAPVERVSSLLQAIGGRNGWLFANILWRIRGWLDELVGGVGLSRGRSRGAGMEAGDAVDFWRVERSEAQSILLRAEMILPGDAWLEFALSPELHGRTRLACRAWFQPRGLLGELYWYALYPVHLLVFAGIVRRIKGRAEASSTHQKGKRSRYASAQMRRQSEWLPGS